MRFEQDVAARQTWQGLKPAHFIALCGMTEVMPCYKADFIEVCARCDAMHLLQSRLQ